MPCPSALQVKRSNWSPPSDTGLWATADAARAALLAEVQVTLERDAKSLSGVQRA